jgi:hypothetical protein
MCKTNAKFLPKAERTFLALVEQVIDAAGQSGSHEVRASGWFRLAPALQKL